MPDILSLRYFPTDVPWRDPGDPGLEVPPEGRPYEIVAKLSDGYTTCEYVHPDWRPVARAEDEPQAVEAAAIARGFAEGRDALYCHEARAWFVWDGALWRQDRDGSVPRAIAALARSRAGRGRAGRGGLGPKMAPRLRARRRRPRWPAWRPPPRFWHAKTRRRRGGTRTRWCSARPAGTVDLAADALRASRPVRPHHTRATAVTPEADATCPLWRRFLDESDGRRCGAGRLPAPLPRLCATGQTSEHALVFGHGDGGNGKTLFANVVRGILGAHAATAASDILAHRGDAQAARAHSAELAMLRGARLVPKGALSLAPQPS